MIPANDNKPVSQIGRFGRVLILVLGFASFVGTPVWLPLSELHTGQRARMLSFGIGARTDIDPDRILADFRRRHKAAMVPIVEHAGGVMARLGGQVLGLDHLDIGEGQAVLHVGRKVVGYKCVD